MKELPAIVHPEEGIGVIRVMILTGLVKVAETRDRISSRMSDSSTIQRRGENGGGEGYQMGLVKDAETQSQPCRGRQQIYTRVVRT